MNRDAVQSGPGPRTPKKDPNTGLTASDGERFPDRSKPGTGAVRGGEAEKPGQMQGDEDRSPKD